MFLSDKGKRKRSLLFHLRYRSRVAKFSTPMPGKEARFFQINRRKCSVILKSSNLGRRTPSAILSSNLCLVSVFNQGGVLWIELCRVRPARIGRAEDRFRHSVSNSFPPNKTPSSCNGSLFSMIFAFFTGAEATCLK